MNSCMMTDYVIRLLLGVRLSVMITATGLQKSHHKLECLPVRANIFWDRSNVKDIFDVQRNYILNIVNNTADRSNVRLDTFDKKSVIPIIRGIKDKENLKHWEKEIANVAVGISEPHMFHASTLIESIEHNQNKNSVKAKVVFLVVDNQTRVDDKDKLVEGLKSYKTFVVFYGRQELSKFWYRIATDDYHFLNPNDNLKANVKPFFRFMCEDSKLRCDRNMYWTGDHCYTCAHVCAIQPSYDPPFCREACPYFRLKEDTENKGNKSHRLLSSWKTIFIFFCLVVLSIYI